METQTDAAAASTDDLALVDRLRRREERAFVQLVERYQGSLLRLAGVYLPSRALAEEVVQETWVGVLRGIGAFGGRSSFRTWLFTILINRARSVARREQRSVPFAALAPASDEDGPHVDPERFRPADHPDWPGHWATPPRSWGASPEELVLSGELREVVAQAMATLPLSQREVMTLRDVEGWSSSEVCNALGLTETHQRVLLHRARSRVRRALEVYFHEP